MNREERMLRTVAAHLAPRLGRGEGITVSVSAVNTFMRDQVAWYCEYVLKRVPRHDVSPGKMAGTVLHTAFETYFKTNDRAEALGAAIKACSEVAEQLKNVPEDKAKRVRNECTLVTLLFEVWQPKYELETLAIEEPFNVELPISPRGLKHCFVGRPDRVARWNGKIWHVQNRSIGGRIPVALYLDTACRDLHELGYAWAIPQMKDWDAPYGGTLLNLVRKITMKQYGEDPTQAFVQEFIPISSEQISIAIDDITAVADDMVAIIMGDRKIIQDRAQDRGKFGNSRDSYFDLKMGVCAPWDDEFFRDAENRYADVPEGDD